MDGPGTHTGGHCYWRHCWVCEHTFHHQTGSNFVLDMTCFSVRLAPTFSSASCLLQSGRSLDTGCLFPLPILLELGPGCWGEGLRAVSCVEGPALPATSVPLFSRSLCCYEPSVTVSQGHFPTRAQQSAVAPPVCRITCVAMEKTSLRQAWAPF